MTKSSRGMQGMHTSPWFGKELVRLVVDMVLSFHAVRRSQMTQQASSQSIYIGNNQQRKPWYIEPHLAPYISCRAAEPSSGYGKADLHR
jgi:hypothetical protein